MRPTIRILHNLARSGGTIISRCLASMDGVALLSEIHPTVCEPWNDPQRQARDWYGIHNLRSTEFDDLVVEIAYRCQEQGRSLVLRSWDNRDFIATSRGHVPPLRSTLVDALPGHDLRRVSILRKPLQSLSSLERFLGEAVDPGSFTRGYQAFLEMPVQHVSYEDFCGGPENALARVCEALDLPYDPRWRDRWQAYHNVTGDVGQFGRTEIGTHP